MKRLQRLCFPHLRLLFSIALDLLIFAEKISQVGFLRGILLPNRRQQSLPVFIAAYERRRPLRPIDVLPPVMFAEVAVFLLSACLPAERALYSLGIGTLLIVAIAMLPSLRRDGVA